MKKFVKLYILTILILFMGMLRVNAAPTLNFNGQKSFDPNMAGTIEIEIKTDNEDISKVSFVVESSVNKEYVTVAIASDPTVVPEKMDLTGSIIQTPTSKDGTIATLTIKNTGLSTNKLTSTLTIKNIVFTCRGLCKDGNPTIGGKNVTQSITLTASNALSSNPQLAQLTLNQGSTVFPFNVNFSSNVKKYKVYLKDTIKNVTVDYDCDGCLPVISCTNCSNPNIDTKIELAMGKNIITIDTKSADRSKSDQYQITVYRGETTDNSNYLASLTVDGYDLNEEFERSLKDFSLTVPYEVDNILVLATTEDSAAALDIKGGEMLEVGENVVIITVTSSETKDKRIYNLTVTRLEEGEEVSDTPVAPVITKKGTNWWLISGIIVASLAAVGGGGYYLWLKKFKGKGKKKPEPITDEGEIKPLEDSSEIEVHENELLDDLNITEEKVRPTVDEALADLMSTKEITLRKD